MGEPGNGTGQAAATEPAAAHPSAAIHPSSVRVIDRIVPGSDGSHAASLPPRRVPAPENPVARVRREIALWTSTPMQEVREVVAEAARIDVTVLISGETGTGKELVARAIHSLGPRCSGPFVKVNCAAVARELLESELFGHERGAFTGAHNLKIGKFEAANNGTIFLDEIGDLHPALQAKLLHVLEDGQFSRVGGHSNLQVDVRVVAASNRDLERAVAAGEFREDLFYRLNVIRITVPPLRARSTEIPSLASYFAARYARLYHRDGFTLPAETTQRLSRYSFPGNVRELENIIKRMIVLRDPDLTRSPLPGLAPGSDGRKKAREIKAAAGSLRDVSRRAALAAEREMIARVLEENQWHRRRAAKVLNISYRSLLYKLKDTGLPGKLRASDQP